MTVTPSDEEFLEFVSQALRVLERQADEVARGEIEVGLIAAGKATAMAQLKALAEEWAHQRAKHETFGAVLRPGVINDGQHFILAHDEVLLAIELDLLARVLAEEDQIARLDIKGHALAIVVHLAIARGDDLALLRLLFGCVGDDDPADFLLALFKALNNDSVVQWSDVHAMYSL